MAKKPRWISVYEYLADWASEGTQTITYGGLAVTLRHFQGTAAHRRHLGGMLLKVSEHCAEQGEPDLTAFVVGIGTGTPGTGYKGPDPAGERAKAHLWHKNRVWGAKKAS